ncbi:MAG: dTMP kinase [Bacteroidetes Order II. Incertae sedis bacterium]|nr:dTMP kinase [Bacteroidetes Order II. bacterium]
MFISFEGIDGSGKTTQAHLLTKRLQASGKEVLLLREPGGTDVSEKVRAILLDSSLHIVPFSEMLLFSAARRQLCETVILPALHAGKVVICDRYLDSTIAYQGYGRTVADPNWVHQFQLAVTDNLLPSRTYLVDVPITLATQRRRIRTADRIEQSGQAFFERVRSAYIQMAEQEADRFRSLDGTLSPEAIHNLIWQDVQSLLGTEDRD